MSNWISSRLKAAEQLLQQFDQQAAEALKKEKEQSREESSDFEQTHYAKNGSSNMFASDQGVALPSQARDRPTPTIFGGKKFASSHDNSSDQGVSSTKKTSSTLNESQKFSRDDWAELLGAPDLNLISSATRSNISRSVDSDGTGASLKASWAKTSSNRANPHSIGTFSAPSNAGLSGGENSGPVSTRLVSEAASASVSGHVQERQTVSVAASSKSEDERDDPETPFQVIRVGSSGSIHEEVIEEESTTVDRLEVEKDSAGDIHREDGERLLTMSGGRDSQVEGERGNLEGTKEDPLAGASEAAAIQQPESEIGTTGVVMTEALEALEKGCLLPEDLSQSHNNQDDSTLLGAPMSGDRSDSFLVGSLLRSSQGSSKDLRGNGGPTNKTRVNSSDSESSGTRTDRDSDSDSDSEYEDKVARRLSKSQRSARHKARKAAAAEAARAAIKKQEDTVSLLEQEQDMLEQMLAEGEAQYVKEADELRANITKVMQLVESEKLSHNNSRLKGLDLEVKLESENAELAKALAAAQWDLEEESSRAAKARTVVEAKAVQYSELEREAARIRWRLSRPNRSQVSLDSYGQHDSLEQEKSRLISKIEQCRTQVEQLTENHKRVIDRHFTPSKNQLELEDQLTQITDSLIQKQAQVEELSTEKATLLFRVETVTNTLREERSSISLGATKRGKGTWAISHWVASEDIEYGSSKEHYSSKDKGWDIEEYHEQGPFSEAAGAHKLLHLVQHIDSVFAGAAYILRRHGIARAFAGLYMLAVHWWVLFILVFHSTSVPEGVRGTGNNLALDLVNATQILGTQNFSVTL